MCDRIADLDAYGLSLDASIWVRWPRAVRLRSSANRGSAMMRAFDEALRIYDAKGDPMAAQRRRAVTP